MFKNAFGYSLKGIQRVCLAGMFISLTVILQKVVAINYIPIMPFVRVSPGGPALIMFSSIFLGPIYGLVVGAGSDLLGYLIFDPKTYGLFPQITAIYALLGFCTYYLFLLLKKINNEKLSLFVLLAVLLSLGLGTSLFFVINDEVTLYSATYTFELWQKIMMPISIFLLIGLLFVVLLIMKKTNKTNNDIMNIWQIGLASFVIEIVIMVLFGSLMKAWAFNFNFFVIAICQIVVLFINVPLNTFLIGTFMRLTKRFKK